MSSEGDFGKNPKLYIRRIEELANICKYLPLSYAAIIGGTFTIFLKLEERGVNKIPISAKICIEYVVYIALAGLLSSAMGYVIMHIIKLSWILPDEKYDKQHDVFSDKEKNVLADAFMVCIAISVLAFVAIIVPVGIGVHQILYSN